MFHTDAIKNSGNKYSKCLAYDINGPSEGRTNAGYSVVIIRLSNSSTKLSRIGDFSLFFNICQKYILVKKRKNGSTSVTASDASLASSRAKATEIDPRYKKLKK